MGTYIVVVDLRIGLFDRYASTEVDRLRSKIKAMSKRIHQLEDALAVAHPSHPLLNGSSSPDADGGVSEGASERIDSDGEADRSAEEDGATVLDSNILHAFGELAISDCKDPISGSGEAEVRYPVSINSSFVQQSKRSS